MSTVHAYAAYLAVSIAFTAWVARSLHTHGRPFLVDTFHGNERLADAVNALLVVGFYLVNGGYVALALRVGERPTGPVAAVEWVSVRVGQVLLILGAMHAFNLFVFLRLRKHRLLATLL